VRDAPEVPDAAPAEPDGAPLALGERAPDGDASSDDDADGEVRGVGVPRAVGVAAGDGEKCVDADCRDAVGVAVTPPLSLAAREAAPLPDPATVGVSSADCEAAADPDVAGLGEGLPVGDASAAEGVAAGLGEASEGDPVAVGAGDTEDSGDAASVDEGEASEVENALGERGAEAEKGALPLLASVAAGVCDGKSVGPEEWVTAAEPESTTPVFVGTPDMVANIVGGNSLAVGLGEVVAAATELLALRVCETEPLLPALAEGAPLALVEALGEAQAVGAAAAVVLALPKGDGEVQLAVCEADPAELRVPQPVLLPLTDARLSVPLELGEEVGSRENEGEPEGQGEAVKEGLLLMQGRALGGALTVPRGLREALPSPLLVKRAVGTSLPLGAPPLPVGRVLLLTAPLALPAPRLGLTVHDTVALTLPSGVRDAGMLAGPLNVQLAEPLLLAPFDASALPLPPEALVAAVALCVGAPPLAVPGAPPLRDAVGDTRALAVAEGGAEARLVAVGKGLAEGLGEGALLLEGEPETLKSSEGVGACVAAGQLLAVALGIIVDAAMAVTPGDMVQLPQCDGAPLPEEEWEGLPDELAPAEAEKVALEEPVEHTVSERSGEPL
jgi:hypothetical protein